MTYTSLVPARAPLPSQTPKEGLNILRKVFKITGPSEAPLGAGSCFPTPKGSIGQEDSLPPSQAAMACLSNLICLTHSPSPTPLSPLAAFHARVLGSSLHLQCLQLRDSPRLCSNATSSQVCSVAPAGSLSPDLHGPRMLSS